MNRRHTFKPLQKTSLALLFASLAAIGLLLAQHQAYSDDGISPEKSPHDNDDPHRFDIRGMDRTELTRAFAGQLTVLPGAEGSGARGQGSVVRGDARRELVFVDPGVPEKEKLLHSIGRKARIIELAPDRDGLSQIAAALERERNVSALHIISHGSEARIKLVGSADVSLETLPEHLEQLRAIHNAMAADGDVLLYGCDIAKGDDGKLFVKLLSQLTGENVAASENLTGAAKRGGDWKLEYSAGTVKTQVFAPEASENYDAVLANVPVNNTSDSGPGSLRNAIATASSGDTIVFSGIANNSTITLTTAGDTSFGPSALAVTTTLTIDGSGAPGLTISGDTTNATRNLRLFIVTGSGNLTLKNITLANGRVRAGNGGGYGQVYSQSGGGGAAGLGGAVFNAGTLQIVQSTLTGNSAIGGDGGAGGALSSVIFGGSGGGGLGGNGGGASRGGGGGGGTSGNGGDSSVYNGGAGGAGGTGGTNGANNGIYTGGVATGAGGGGGAFYAAGGYGGLGGGGGGGGSSFGPGYGLPGGYGGFGGGGGAGGGAGGPGGLSGYGGSGGFGGGGGAGGPGNAGGGAYGGFGGGFGGAGAANGQLGGGGGGGGAGMGGAIFNYSGTLTLSNSTISGNSATGGSGGAANYNGGLGGNGGAGQGLGGGIFNRSGACTILNCTIDANTAADGGGEIYNLGDGFGTATLTLSNSILADSVGGGDDLTQAKRSLGAASTTATDPNIIPVITIFSFTTFNSSGVINANPQVSALASNGGPTQTMALKAASPAINAGSNTAAASLTTDQRGFVRVASGTVDIGAFEVQVPPAVTSVNPTSGSTTGGTTVTITGNGFTGATAVKFGANFALSFTVNSATQITATSPSGSPGPVDVTVTTPGGTSAASAADKFTYTLPVFAIPISIFSPPTATPNPAVVQQTVQFTAAALGGSGTLTYSWNFGDGATGSGSSVTHAYAAAGVYAATLTVTDGNGGSATGSVSVTVNAAVPLDPNGDANGDGYTNDVALALGANPAAPNMTPLGLPVVTTSNGNLAIKQLRIKLDFSAQNSDGIRISGTLPGVTKLPAESTLVLNVGHVIAAYTFDKHGRAFGSTGPHGVLNDTCQLRVSAKGATFTAKLLQGSFQAPLSSEPNPAFDLTSTQGSSPTRSVNVTVYFGSTAYKATVMGKYKAASGSFTK